MVNQLVGVGGRAVVEPREVVGPRVGVGRGLVVLGVGGELGLNVNLRRVVRSVGAVVATLVDILGLDLLGVVLLGVVLLGVDLLGVDCGPLVVVVRGQVDIVDVVNGRRPVVEGRTVDLKVVRAGVV